MNEIIAALIIAHPSWPLEDVVKAAKRVETLKLQTSQGY